MMKLTSLEQVQQRVGKLPAPRNLKVIDYVDEHAMRWLSYSQFGFVGFGKAGGIRLSAVGGEKGFASVLDSKHLQVSVSAVDGEDVAKVAEVAEVGFSFGALFLVSGMDETLRVNGKVSAIADGLITLTVEECYLHCAKAFRRSNFWLPKALDKSCNETSKFIEQATFLALATIDDNGQADVSPKGDPKGYLIQEEDGFIYLADRPGNRRIDSFRNILQQPEVSIMALIPGSKEMLSVQGTAELCIDEALLQRFNVQGKEPKLIVKITPSSIETTASIALKNSALWPAKATPDDLVPAEIFKAHINQSKEKSLPAKIARAVVSLPGAMKKGLDTDYKNNMY